MRELAIDMMNYLWVIIPLALVLFLTFLALSRRRARPRETAMEAYVDGLRTLIAGDEQTAFIKFRQAVDQDTGNIDAYLKMGDIFRNRGLTDKALQIHRELRMRRDVPDETLQEIDKSLAQDYAGAGMKEKAYEILERMTKDGAARHWAGEKLLELYTKDRKWKEAAELCQEVYKKGSRQNRITLANFKLMMGLENYQSKEYHKARILYKEALGLNKIDPLPFLYIAESYLEEKRVEDGLDFLKRLCREVPRYAYLGFPMIEETLFQLGRYGEVEDIYRGMLNDDPSNLPAKVALAGILEKKGELSAAESLLKSVLELDPGNSPATLRLAGIMASCRRIDEGLGVLSDLADRMNQRNQEFKCRKCGKVSLRLLPSCPHCAAMGTYL
jgi:lipopolysaccharide biosynthesis regulator YciM